MRRSFFGVSAVAALSALHPMAVEAAEEERTAAYTVIQSGATTVEVDQEVGDLLLIDAKADIRGVVRGHVFSVDSEVVVRSTAVVLKSMTINKGTLRVEMGAVLPQSIALADAHIIGPYGEVSPLDGQKVELGRAGTTLSVLATKLSTASVALMKSVLPFDRFTPEAGMSMKDLEAWDPGLGLELKKNDASPKEVTVGGITKLAFVSGNVKGAFQKGYKGARGTVLLTAVELKDAPTAKALWSEIERVAPEAKVALSLKTSLGDGSHWYFRNRGRHAMLWQRGPWFFAVETKLSSEDTTAFQERQFNDQVLSQLRTELAARKFERRATHASGVMK
jgi:hypothetical protein